MSTRRTSSPSAGIPLVCALACIALAPRQTFAMRRRADGEGEPTFESMIRACGKSRARGLSAWCARRSRARA
jgi:hypothetical protein